MSAANKGNGGCFNWLLANAQHQGDDCLIWPFTRHPTGYGAFGHFGKQNYAHRFMCQIAHGPPPSRKHQAGHSCGRGHDGCVNPRHLSWKTRSENQLDRRTHGTSQRNPGGRKGKLTETQIADIRALRGIRSQQYIARMFGVSRPTISFIFSGKVHRVAYDRIASGTNK